MKKVLFAAVSLVCASAFAAAGEVLPAEVSCSVSSRNQELGKFKAFVGPLGAMEFHDVTQNDGSVVTYRIAVTANEGSLTLSVMDNNRKVPVNTWFATDLVAEGQTDLRDGAKLSVSTGTVANAASVQSLLRVECVAK